MTTFICLLVPVIFVCVSTLISLSRAEQWWIRIFDFPRVQLFIFASLLLLLQLFLLDLTQLLSWTLIVPVVAAMLYQAYWILPYTQFFPVEVKPAAKLDPQNKLTIITANVLTHNKQSDKLLKLINHHQPDIIVTLESDSWWQSQLDLLHHDYPHRVNCPQDNLYGMHLYSKYALKNTRVAYLVESDVPSIHTLVRLPSGQQLRMHFIHPAPPSPTENAESSERDAELIMIAKSIADSHSDMPVIVTGDLNDVAWSPTTRLFRKISGLLDPRIGRGMFNTFHAEYRFLRWPLDHLFHSHHFQVYTIKRLAYFGSDHFPLMTTLMLCQDAIANADSNGLEADKADKAWAREKMADEDVHSREVPNPEEPLSPKA